MNNCRGASFKDALSDSDVTTSGTYDNTNPIVAPLRGPDSQQSSSQFTITGTASCSYDAQNRLRSATVNGITETFLYDGLNRKFSQTISGTTTVNIWDGWNLIQEYNSGSSVANYSYVYGVGGILERLDNGGANPIFYFQDALGNTAYVTDASANMIERYKYDRFGNVTIYNSANQQLSASSYDIRHLYTGQLWLPQLGLYDLRNRVYSPTIQRFMQADPVGFSGDNANLYRYGSNNSLNTTDYLGLLPGHILLQGGPNVDAGVLVGLGSIFHFGLGLGIDINTSNLMGSRFYVYGQGADNVVGGGGALAIGLETGVGESDEGLSEGFSTSGLQIHLQASIGVGENGGGSLDFSGPDFSGNPPSDFAGGISVRDMAGEATFAGAGVSDTLYYASPTISQIFDSVVNFFKNLLRSASDSRSNQGNGGGNSSLGGSNSAFVSPANPYGLYGVVQVYGAPGTTGSRIPPQPVKRH